MNAGADQSPEIAAFQCSITGCSITSPHGHTVIDLDAPLQVSPESYGCARCNGVWPIGGAHLCVGDLSKRPGSPESS